MRMQNCLFCFILFHGRSPSDACSFSNIWPNFKLTNCNHCRWIAYEIENLFFSNTRMEKHYINGCGNRGLNFIMHKSMFKIESKLHFSAKEINQIFHFPLFKFNHRSNEKESLKMWRLSDTIFYFSQFFFSFAFFPFSWFFIVCLQNENREKSLSSQR